MKSLERKSMETKLTKSRKLAKKLSDVRRAISIPDDIISNILLRLSVRSIGRFRCVSKSWLLITSNISFIRSHAIRTNSSVHQSLIIQTDLHERSITGELIKICNGQTFHLASANAKPGVSISIRMMPMEEKLQNYHIKASCDGLICVKRWYSSKYAIVNPLTGHSINIPDFDKCGSYGNYFGLYFHHSTSKYRLLLSVIDDHIRNYVLVVGENSWRYITCCHHFFHQQEHPVDVNGSLYWFVYKEKNPSNTVLNFNTQYGAILTFDKETEEFGSLSLPLSKKRKKRGGNLFDFNEKLGFWVVGNDGVIDVWIMEEFWIKSFSILCASLRGCLDILETWRPENCVFGNATCIGDEELLIDIPASTNLRYLVRWNLKSKDYVVQSFINFYCSINFALSYRETLLNPCEL